MLTHIILIRAVVLVHLVDGGVLRGAICLSRTLLRHGVGEIAARLLLVGTKFREKIPGPTAERRLVAEGLTNKSINASNAELFEIFG